ncbi:MULTISPECIES: S8 family serine peptidase [unclassified Nocardioides]|uniref:S8 family serine peptidase n=1 Tax=unclassified Nocardioides TaxID=2615069 RepID=UPI0012E37BA1|nr:MULTISPECIES: S8 family serine peptidase [unclassified Nocardioides]
MTVRRPLIASVAALVCGPVLLFPGESVAHQTVAVADGPECGAVSPDDDVERPVTGENTAMEALQVPQAWSEASKAGKRPGAGVTVVVVDSGITGVDERGPSPLKSAHGLIVGGIIAGPNQPKPAVSVGIAPGARMVDEPFYDVPRGEEQDGVRVPMSDALEARLKAITARRRSGQLKGPTIVVVPMEVLHTDSLEKAVQALVASGALVIAAAGDRPAADDSFLKSYAGETAAPGEDAVADVWPAGGDGVVSVGVSTPTDGVLRNSGIDLAAPGTGSVSKALNGAWCVVTTVSSHWAAAQVAGVAAVVWSVHRSDTAQQLEERLEGTASGNSDGASPLTGYGVVQPVEAILRDINGMGAEGHEADVVPRAKVPRERADLLADARENAVWWGLGGGGALVILLVLRPVLARRRAGGGSDVRR